MKPRPIAVYGAGGCGRQTGWLINSCNRQEAEYQLVCYIDDNPLIQGNFVKEIPILTIEEAAIRFPGIRVISGIADPTTRQLTMNKAAAMGFGTDIVIHPRAEISPSVTIGPGSWIAAGSIVSTDVSLGLHVQINSRCLVGHDLQVGDFTTLGPGVVIPGRVFLGKRVSVGPGAIFLEGKRDDPLTIGSDVIIGAGALISESIPPGERLSHGRSSLLTTISSPPKSQEWVYPEIEEGVPTRFTWMVQHLSNFKLGYLTDIGAFTYINAKYGVIIEDHVQVGSHCSIYSVSTIDNKKGPVHLKKNCRVGSHSVILPGVTIGINAVIGACSLVNADIPDNVIAFGIPAKIFKNLV